MNYTCSTCREHKKASEFYKKDNKNNKIKRSVSYECRQCTQKKRKLKRGMINGVCSECYESTLIYFYASECKKCLKKKELRYCNKCTIVQPTLSFYGRRTTCKVCLNPTPHLTRSEKLKNKKTIKHTGMTLEEWQIKNGGINESQNVLIKRMKFEKILDMDRIESLQKEVEWLKSQVRHVEPSYGYESQKPL